MKNARDLLILSVEAFKLGDHSGAGTLFAAAASSSSMSAILEHLQQFDVPADISESSTLQLEAIASTISDAIAEQDMEPGIQDGYVEESDQEGQEDPDLEPRRNTVEPNALPDVEVVVACSSPVTLV